VSKCKLFISRANKQLGFARQKTEINVKSVSAQGKIMFAKTIHVINNQKIT